MSGRGTVGRSTLIMFMEALQYLRALNFSDCSALLYHQTRYEDSVPSSRLMLFIHESVHDHHTSHITRLTTSRRTIEKRSHLIGGQGEDCYPRLVCMPRLVPNSPFRRSATRLPSEYRGLSWHPKPAGMLRRKGFHSAARNGMSC